MFYLVQPNFKFYLKFPILTNSHSFLEFEFSGPDRLDLGMLSLRPHMFQLFFSIIRDAMEEYLAQMVWKNKCT